jgi:hypothetical protein
MCATKCVLLFTMNLLLLDIFFSSYFTTYFSPFFSPLVPHFLYNHMILRIARAHFTCVSDHFPFLHTHFDSPNIAIAPSLALHVWFGPTVTESDRSDHSTT